MCKNNNLFLRVSRSKIALPVAIVAATVAVFLAITPSIYLPAYIETFCMADERSQLVPGYVLNSDEVREFKKKYSGYDVKTAVFVLTSLPPKMSYGFSVTEKETSESLIRINDVCVNDDYSSRLTCSTANEVHYEIYGKQNITDMLKERDCFSNVSPK